MSKGYMVYSLMRQPQENVIDEELIRSCIYLAPTASSEEERIRVVGNKEEALLREKMREEMANMELDKVTCLLLSFRRIRKIENLCGLGGLTKLCLDNNHLTKIENLGHLKTLQWLDLSFNQIQVIEGLDDLVQLENLSLFANEITAITGLDQLHKLTTLSLGNNRIDNLDDTARALHRLKQLRVLILSGCHIETMPHYRVRMLAFVPTLRFLDGKAVRAQEIAQAREEQHENVLPLDEEDEKQAAQEKLQAEEESVRKDYELYNCPNETRLCNDLCQLRPDGRDVMEVLRHEAVISSSKEVIDRFQGEFNERAKELADALRAIRGRRDKDDAAYTQAMAQYTAQNTAASRELMKQFEAKLKAYVPKGIGSPAMGASHTQELSPELATELHENLTGLQSALLELELRQYNAFEALNNTTLTRWRGDGVDVLLQGAFEGFFKLENDFQTALRQIFDSLFEQRQKRDRNNETFYYSKREESVAAVLDNKEEYQKMLSDWAEMRRKYLEGLEVLHIRREEQLLAERARRISEAEQERHRARLVEIAAYISQMSNTINARST